ncbi:MAG: class I SAM-dependent methyltransferase [Methylocystis sp.]|uniref:class I SAM-dependent methyltransferase n=1 Tax=Methylocystis sp. TaxID=1911079 RepID=UPI003DA59092
MQLNERTVHPRYSGYEVWKAWDKPFTYSAEDDAYFAGETRGIVVAGGRLLEVGYGSGSFLAWARDKGAEVAGVEIIPSLVEAAARAGIETLPPTLENIKTTIAPFDTIVALDVFEHLTLGEIRHYLHACAALAAERCHLLLRFPNAQSPFGLAPQNGDATHVSQLSQGVFEQLIQDTPWRIVRYAPAYRLHGGGLFKRLRRWAQYAARDLISAFLNATYNQTIPWDPVVVLVLCRKDCDTAGATLSGANVSAVKK